MASNATIPPVTRSRVLAPLAIALIAAGIVTAVLVTRSTSAWSNSKARTELAAMDAQRAADIDHYNQLNGTTNAATLNVLCAELATDDQQLAPRIDAGHWPHAARQAAADFATAVRAETRAFVACASAPTLDEIQGALAAGTSASSARLALEAKLSDTIVSVGS